MGEGGAILICVLREGPLQGMTISADGHMQCGKNGVPIKLGKETITGKGKANVKKA
jgi:hypothetical protein